MSTPFPTRSLVILRVQCRDSLLMLWYVDGMLREDLCVLRSWN